MGKGIQKIRPLTVSEPAAYPQTKGENKTTVKKNNMKSVLN